MELKELIEAQGKAFEEFKKANDERLAKLAKGEAVSELEAKLAKINETLDTLGKAMDEMSKKSNRTPAPVADEHTALATEHKEAFIKWLRKGEDAGLAELEKKAWSAGSLADGGYAIPEVLDRNIMRLLQNFSPMRQVCHVLTIGGESYRKLVNLGGTAAGWVGETAARPTTATSQFTQIKPTMAEIYANPEVTQTALDDLFFDVEGELTRDIAEAFAKAEGVAWLAGTGQTGNQPVGLLTAPTSTDIDGTRAFGTFQHIATGNATGLPAKAPADKLLDLIYATKAGHRQNGKFMMNSATLSAVRKWKDSQDNYLWQPSMQEGQPARIFGYELVVNEYMPDIEENKIPVLFGDFQAAFWIFDRMGIRQVRDPFTNKPFVSFYTTRREGSMINNTEALKFLKVCA